MYIFILGCKIKALRAKTNTYIKTPVRGEEPVFVVTGRKEDDALAKAEILSAADHFSQVYRQLNSIRHYKDENYLYSLVIRQCSDFEFHVFVDKSFKKIEY